MGGKSFVKGLVCGFGINDSDYPTNPFVNGVRVCCPYYRVWSSMLKRCYSKSFLKYRPTYADCSVDKRWERFMDFRAWMALQDWEGKELDKDLLSLSNKIYSPETCVFVPREVNQFLNERTSARGDHALGVTWFDNKGRNFKANCRVMGVGTKYLGSYYTEQEAHNAYLVFKATLARELALKQSDKRVSEALLLRYCKN